MKIHRPPSERPGELHGMVTVSPEMHAFFERLRRVARTEAPVLVRGETGTGKELVARALHALSGRARGPFQAVNCATLTPEMLASQLFGHVRGAFTGAVRDRPGLFRLADGGTIFLDEIAELPLDLQARLLRVLQERSFVPLGGTDSIHVDLRLISATNQALRQAVEERRFRLDLMYRIRVVPLFLPRLVERTGDIEALTWHLIAQLNERGWRRVDGIAADAWDALASYDWPGNVRELENVLTYAFAVGEGPTLTVDELTPELRGEAPESADSRSRGGPRDDRRELLEALARTGGRKGEAADLLGISRSTLWRRLREHRIG